MPNQKILAIQSLVRRGVSPVNVRENDAALAAKGMERNMRGNVSQQKSSVRTGKDLDALRQRRRKKLEQEKTA